MKLHKACMTLGLLVMALLWTLSCGPSSTPTPTQEATDEQAPQSPASPGSDTREPTATATPTPTPTPSPLQILEKSSLRMLALDTASFTLSHEGDGSSQLLPGIQVQLVEGRVDMPDRFSVRVEAVSTFPRSFIEISVVAVGEEAYMTDFINRERLIPIPVGDLPFDFADLGRTLSDIIIAIQAPVVVGTESVEGVASWRIRGPVASEALGTLIPAAGPGYEVTLELWIGRADGLLTRVRIEGQVLSTDAPDLVRVLTIYDFDEPLEISLPAITG